MTPTINPGKPWCCYCNEEGTGRIVFKNLEGDVIDNPYCDKHMQVVCKHTVRLLKKRAKESNKEPQFIIQKWSWGHTSRPNLPSYGEFMAKHYAHVVTYQKMLETEIFNHVI